MFSKVISTLRKPKKSLTDELSDLAQEYRAEQENLPNSLVRALYLESNKEYKTTEKMLLDLQGSKVFYTDEDFLTALSAKLAVIIEKHSNHLPKQFIEQRRNYQHQAKHHSHMCI